MRTRKPSDKLRDMDTPMVLGVELNRQTLTPVHRPLPRLVEGQDYGCDPIGTDLVTNEFMYKMVPSGDIVNHAEKTRRLEKR